MPTFGENLKKARKRLKMNQQALGDAVGVGQTTIANYEKGLRFPTGELLKRIAEILNESIDDLMSHKVLNLNKLDKDFDLGTYQDRFLSCLIDGREQEALVMIWDLQPSEGNLVFIYEQMLKTTMDRIGELWVAGEISIVTEHHASQVVHKIIAMLSTIPGTMAKKGKNAICMSLSSESHTIGIKMISEYLNFLGVQSLYIGRNVPTDSLIDRLIKKEIDILAVSITMPSYLDQLKNLIEVLRNKEALKGLQIIIGGQGIMDSENTITTMDVNGYAKDFATLKQWLEDNHIV